MLARTFAETKIQESKSLSSSQATDISNAMGTISGLRLGYQITVNQPASKDDVTMAARYISVINPSERKKIVKHWISMPNSLITRTEQQVPSIQKGYPFK